MGETDEGGGGGRWGHEQDTGVTRVDVAFVLRVREFLERKVFPFKERQVFVCRSNVCVCVSSSKVSLHSDGSLFFSVTPLSCPSFLLPRKSDPPVPSGVTSPP